MSNIEKRTAVSGRVAKSGRVTKSGRVSSSRNWNPAMLAQTPFFLWALDTDMVFDAGVSEWTNRGSLGGIAYQYDVGHQPAFSKPYILPAGDQWMIFDDPLITDSANWTVALVIKTLNVTTTNYAFSIGGTLSNNGIEIGITSSKARGITFKGVGEISDGVAQDQTVEIWIVSRVAGVLKFYLNSDSFQPLDSPAANMFDPTVSSVIGAAFEIGLSQFFGSIGAIVASNYVWSSDDRSKFYLWSFDNFGL